MNRTSFHPTYVLGALVLLASQFAGCMSAAQHSQSLHSAAERELTVGIVQKQITKGMSQADVAQALGSPNIVTKDDAGDETWIYDKIATEASYSHDTGSFAAAGGAGKAPGESLLLGGLISSYSRNAGASATTNRTLTVVIKFDKQGKVKGFSYHASKF